MIPLSLIWIGKATIFGTNIVFYKDISTDDYWGYWHLKVRGEDKAVFHRWTNKPTCLI